MAEVLCFVGVVGACAAVLLIVVLSLLNKNAYAALGLFALCVVIILGSGFLPQNNADQEEAKPISDTKTSNPADTQNGNSGRQPDPGQTDDTEQGQGQDQGQDAPEDQPLTTPINAGDSAGNLGDCYVEIKDASIVNDYDGNPAIVITYAWTNNGEDTTNAEIEFMEKAFQDGVELSTAFIGNSSLYNSELSFKDVRPGTSFDVQCAFELTSESSVIEFELTEFLSFSDDVVKKEFDPMQLG